MTQTTADTTIYQITKLESYLRNEFESPFDLGGKVAPKCLQVRNLLPANSAFRVLYMCDTNCERDYTGGG